MKFRIGGALRGFVVKEPSPSHFAISAPSPAALLEGNGSSTLFAFTVTRSGELGVAATLAWAVTGIGGSPANSGDFLSAMSGTVSFAAGQATAMINALVKGDASIEADEGFQVTISSPSYGLISVASAVATILNDDTLGAGGTLDSILMEDGASFILAEDGSKILDE